MKQFDYPLLAKEGWIHLVIAMLCGTIATWLWGYISISVWILVLFIMQFFRDPKRHISTQRNAVVSPASGKIVSVGEEDNPYIEGVKSLKVSIFMSVFSVHSNLIPISGEIKDVWYHPGTFFNAALDKASCTNERNAVWIRTEDGNDIISVQIAGLIARRILCYVKKGDRVKAGQRYGFIRFGSRSDLYLPLHTKLSIRLGQWVNSGNDVVGMVQNTK